MNFEEIETPANEKSTYQVLPSSNYFSPEKLSERYKSSVVQSQQNWNNFSNLVPLSPKFIKLDENEKKEDSEKKEEVKKNENENELNKPVIESEI